MNFHTKDTLDMSGYDIKTFEFDVVTDTPYFIVNDHNEPLKGFKLEILSQANGSNKQITNGKFSIRLIRENNMGISNNLEFLDVTLGICTFPNNKCVKTLEIKIN